MVESVLKREAKGKLFSRVGSGVDRVQPRIRRLGARLPGRRSILGSPFGSATVGSWLWTRDRMDRGLAASERVNTHHDGLDEGPARPWKARRYLQFDTGRNRRSGRLR